MNIHGTLQNATLTGSALRDDLTARDGNDLIRLDAALGVSSLAALSGLMRPVGGGDDTLIDFGGGNSLRLSDVRPNDLVAGDFLFG